MMIPVPEAISKHFGAEENDLELTPAQRYWEWQTMGAQQWFSYALLGVKSNPMCS